MESNNILTSLKQAAEAALEAVKDVWAAIVEAVKKALAAIKKMHDDALRRYKVMRFKCNDLMYWVIAYHVHFWLGNKVRAWLAKKYLRIRFGWKVTSVERDNNE